jgi:hypothetical protein
MKEFNHTKMAQMFPYELDPNLGEYTDQPAVYRLHFGGKFFVFKGKSFIKSVEQNLTDIWKLRWNQQQKVDHLFYPIVMYIKSARPQLCRVELITQTDDPHELVQSERNMLALASRDEPDKLLNTNLDPIIPKWLSEQMSSTEPNIKQPVKNKRREIKPQVEKKVVSEPKIPAETKSRTVAKQTEPSGKLSALMDAFSKINGKEA